MKLRFNHHTHILHDAEDGQHIAELCDGVHYTVGAGIAAAVNAVDTTTVQLMELLREARETMLDGYDDSGDWCVEVDTILGQQPEPSAPSGRSSDDSGAANDTRKVRPAISHAVHDKLVAALDAARSVLADAGCELTVMNQIDEALSAAGLPAAGRTA